MYRRLLVLVTKILIKILRMTGSSGSALPGLIIERLYSKFLHYMLTPVQSRIILITGTNGKTTTTKMIVAGLRGNGKRVITNSTGSNLTRGLIAALLDDMTYFGTLKSTDWFVFELDEAYAPVFTAMVSPHVVVALNVLRDQLDRYGELDKTATLILRAAQKSDIFIFNATDPLLASGAKKLNLPPKNLISFTVDKSLLANVVNEQTLHEHNRVTQHASADITLKTLRHTDITQDLGITTTKNDYDLTIPVQGFHNALNGVAVVALLDIICKENEIKSALTAIQQMPVPFGRGEQIKIQHQDFTVALVKNPAGFTSNLETFLDPRPDAILFVINDNFADGRDVSWLWDVSFSPYISAETPLYTSGVRAYDMTLRLKHDGLKSTPVISVNKAIETIIESPAKNVVIIPTYTALFEVRLALSRYGKVPKVW